MALVIADRVRETTTTAGTGSVTLAGAVTGFQSFSVIGDTNTCYYCISDQSGSNWEVGIGTYSTTGPTLARTTVLASSNAGSLVSFGSNTKDVFVTQPAERAIYTQATGNRIEIYNPVIPSNDGWGVIECVDDGLGDAFNDLNIYLEDQYGNKNAPFFSGGIASADFVIRSQDWTTNYHFVRLYAPSGMTGDYTLTLPSTTGSANQVLKTDGTGVTSWTNTFILGAGTATVAPLKLTSGTNLTTAEAGAIEYNGTAAFITGTAASGRGISLAPQMVRVNTNRNKATNNTTLEAIFDAANDALALAANTLYYFKGMYIITTAASATAAGVQVGFLFSNAQQDIGYRTLGHLNTLGTGQNTTYNTVATATTTTVTNTTAATYCIEVEGWFKSNATTGGTIIPAFTQSVVGTSAAPIANANSWFMVQPMSSNPSATLIAGNWS